MKALTASVVLLSGLSFKLKMGGVSVFPMLVTTAIFYVFCLSFSLLLMLLMREYRRLLKDIDHLNTKLAVKADLIDKLEAENDFLTQRNRMLRKDAFRTEIYTDDLTFSDDKTMPSYGATVSRRDIQALQDEITSIKDLIRSQL